MKHNTKHDVGPNLGRGTEDKADPEKPSKGGGTDLEPKDSGFQQRKKTVLGLRETGERGQRPAPKKGRVHKCLFSSALHPATESGLTF